MNPKRNVQQSYGSAVIGAGNQQQRIPLTKPVDDVIWLGFNEAEHAAKYVLKLWLPLVSEKDVDEIGEPDAREFLGTAEMVVAVQRAGAPAAFLAAAHKAADGRFPVEIAPYLADVLFGRGGKPDVIPDLLPLAAWCLDRLLRTREFEVRDCAICEIPFLASPEARYCRRPAPTSVKQTCLEIGKVRDYQARKRAKRGTPNG